MIKKMFSLRDKHRLQKEKEIKGQKEEAKIERSKRVKKGRKIIKTKSK